MTIPVAAAALTAVLLFAQAQRPIFHAGTHSIVVPVTVFDGDQIVATLTPKNFQIPDTAVKQFFPSADRSTLPTALRLFFDPSGITSEKNFNPSFRPLTR